MTMHEDTDDRARSITGVITLADGTTSGFGIGEDGGWYQDSAPRERLSRSVDILDAMVRGLLEDNLLTSASDPDPEDEEEEQGPALTPATARRIAELMLFGEGQGVVHLDDWVEILGQYTADHLDIPLDRLTDEDTEEVARLIRDATVTMPPSPDGSLTLDEDGGQA